MFKEPRFESGYIDTTSGLFLSLGIDINMNNDYIEGIISRDVFSSIIQQRPELSQELKEQYYELRRSNAISARNRAVPTCAEVSENGDLVVLWRESLRFMGGGNAYPFLGSNKAVLVKEGVIKRVKLEGYPREELFVRHDMLVPGSQNKEVISADTINKIMLYESSPEMYVGYLDSVFEEI